MNSIKDLVRRFPRQAKTLKYGTAGFRDRADLPLNSMFARMGVLAVLRSRSAKQSVIGAMITASHNDECDNGVKLTDPDGGMLSSSWESYTESLANASTAEEFLEAVAAIETSEGISGATGGTVMVGRDTRPHSAEFLTCVSEGVAAMGGVLLDLGIVTTPQLHFAVRRANEKSLVSLASTFSANTALEDYNNTLAAGFSTLLDSVENNIAAQRVDSLVIDGSCGVGAPAVCALLQSMRSRGECRLEIDVRNHAGSGPVNEGCGAELVQKQQVPPRGVSAEVDTGRLLCSFDGDADRIVFHMFTIVSGSWVLIDGDKIAALLAVLLREELNAAGLADVLSMGVVQTAYANGASSAFLRARGVTVAMAKTGVKFLHHEALAFDVGVYFEANGHGTVLFSPRAVKQLQEQEAALGLARSDPSSAFGTAGVDADTDASKRRQRLAVRRLHACTQVINQAVGDALSDMLAAIAALRILDLTPAQWAALFSDLPSRQLKQAVRNKAAIECSDDETRVLRPAALAAKLETAMSAVPLGRCFVRPSGTEDVVRVYAEAETQAAADELAETARKAMIEFCE